MTLQTFLDDIIIWAPGILHFEGLGMRNLQMKWGFAKNVMIKPLRRFMYGSNFYVSAYQMLFD